jgi:RNA polymerase sigma-70 factor (ECF subfamily)
MTSADVSVDADTPVFCDEVMADVHATLESIFRAKYGELSASLLAAFGFAQFELVEEALQTAFERALERWPQKGVPENPAGWLYAVARNNCLEALRHASVADRKARQLRAEQPQEPAVDPDAGLAHSIPGGLDDFAAMILLCCNPDLSEKAQLCLTLKAGCGLSVQQIGRLLGMADEAVKKTVTRAKEKVALEAATFGALDRVRITSRFPLVIETVYALFTEGYAASSGDQSLRRDVAAQAVHLCDVLIGSSFTPTDAHGPLHALMALMLLQLARFDARVGSDGVPVRLQEQDRGRWNQSMIRAGLDALRAASTAAVVTPYHLEARIAAEHSTSTSFDRTNWRLILDLYDQLLTLKDTPAVRLNLVVAICQAKGPTAALEQLDALAAEGPTPAATAFLRHAIRADILDALGHHDEARQSWRIALASAPTDADRAFVARRARTDRGDVPATNPRASS